MKESLYTSIIGYKTKNYSYSIFDSRIGYDIKVEGLPGVLNLSKKLCKNTLIYNGDADITEYLLNFIIEQENKMLTRHDYMDEVVDSEVVDEVAEQKSKSIADRFTAISGKAEDSVKAFNSEDLESLTTLNGMFEEAKGRLSQYNQQLAKPKPSGIFAKFMRAEEKQEVEIKTIQQNIDTIFNGIEAELDKTTKVGNELLVIRQDLKSQIEALEELSRASAEERAGYGNELVPLNVIKIDTLINSTLDNYKSEILEVEANIMATQGIVISISTNLPGMKAALERGAASNSRISKITNVHGKVTEVARLISNVAQNTADQTFEKVAMVLDSQLNDTTMIEHLRGKADQTNAFATMLSDKSLQLSAKYTNEAREVTNIINANLAIATTKTLKQLNG